LFDGILRKAHTLDVKTFLYPSVIIRALELAAMWHEGQLRKHPEERIPYIAHPAGVGFLLQRAGFDDEVIAAGILHDVIEDCGVTPEQLIESMGQRVTDLVLGVTEPKDATWEERKRVYVKNLAEAPVESLAIACADHIYNIRSMMESAKTMKDVWTMFYATREQRLGHEHEVLKIIESRLQHELVSELRQVLEQAEHVL
jgi:(p)ppGpp synthase/HD superfamily hydrolase